MASKGFCKRVGCFANQGYTCSALAYVEDHGEACIFYRSVEDLRDSTRKADVHRAWTEFSGPYMGPHMTPDRWREYIWNTYGYRCRS